MAWTPPRSWTPGEFVTALMLDTQVRDNLLALYAMVSGAGNPAVCNGRLTLETGVAVSMSDQADKTHLRFTPFEGKQVGLYSGSSWDILSFSEVSLDMSALTASKMYDVFAYNNAGSLALEALAWSTASARATAWAVQDGVLVKSGAPTRRLLGSVYLDASQRLQDTVLKRHVSNLLNRRARPLARHDSTASWSTTTSWRSANNSSANAVSVVSCLDAWLDLMASLCFSIPQVAQYGVATGIGEDSTSAPVSEGVQTSGAAIGSSGDFAVPVTSTHHLRKVAPLGYHVYNWLDYATSTITAYGAQSGTWWKTRTGMTGYITG